MKRLLQAIKLNREKVLKNRKQENFFKYSDE
jgi:hypothetical protein